MTYAELEAALGRTNAFIAMLLSGTAAAYYNETFSYTFEDWMEIVETIKAMGVSVVRETLWTSMRQTVKTAEQKVAICQWFNYDHLIREAYAAAGDNLALLVVVHDFGSQDPDVKQTIAYRIGEMDRPFDEWASVSENLPSDHPLLPLVIWKMSRKVESFEQRFRLCRLLPDKHSQLAIQLLGEMVDEVSGPADMLAIYKLIPGDGADLRGVLFSLLAAIMTKAEQDYTFAIEVYKVDPQFETNSKTIVSVIKAHAESLSVATDMFRLLDRKDSLYAEILHSSAQKLKP